MALITEEDIKALKNKKADAETTIKATNDAFDKANNELNKAIDRAKDAVAEQRDENPNNLDSLNSLIADLEAKLKIPGEVNKEVDPTSISIWGELVYEIVDMDFVEANEDAWTETRSIRDALMRQRSDDAQDVIEAKYDDFSDGISDEEDRAKFAKAFDVVKESYEASFKATVEVMMATSPKEKTYEILTKWIVDEVDNSDLVIRFNKEKEERKEAIADSFKRADRQKALLTEKHDGLEDEKKDLTSDNDLIKKEFAEEMGITGEGEDVLVKESLSRLKEKQNAFTASNAIELTRDSLFNLEIIIGKIKEACSKGFSNVKITGDEISGTQLYSLIDLGYKVTHDTVFNQGRNRDNTVYTIDWTFAPSAA